jgi:hypothetical protein
VAEGEADDLLPSGDRLDAAPRPLLERAVEAGREAPTPA